MANPKIILVFFCFILFCLPVSESPCQSDTVILSLHFRVAEEVLPIVEKMLSREGSATADVRTNSLVVTDNESSVRKIRSFLSDFDKPGRQVRISVRFREVETGGGRSISAEGRVSDEHWSMGTGGKRENGIDVTLRDRSRGKDGVYGYSINTMSGSQAYILAGKEIPYRERWTDLSRRYGGYVDTVILRRIETGMEVMPIVMGDSARIEITPRISHAGRGGKRGIVRFTRASTVLSVPLGQWVTIGGADRKSHEVIREILKSGTGKRSSSLVISLKVEAL